MTEARDPSTGIQDLRSGFPGPLWDPDSLRISVDFFQKNIIKDSESIYL